MGLRSGCRSKPAGCCRRAAHQCVAALHRTTHCGQQPCAGRQALPQHGLAAAAAAMEDAAGCPRERTHLLASSSTAAVHGGGGGAACAVRRWQARAGPTGRRRADVATRALFDPPPFQPEKLTVTLAPGTTPLQPCPPHRNRKYTLTHNDITGSLQLSIGPDYNQQQISGFYTRLLRDEVTAEWRCGGPAGRCSLHVQCHVSGEEMWLAPPLLRNYIFRREMPLVLDTLVYADRALLAAQPDLARARVYIHFQSSAEELDTVECWGVLGDRSSWAKSPTSIMLRMIYAVVGWPLGVKAIPADLSIDQPSEPQGRRAGDRRRLLQQQQQQQEDGLPPDVQAEGAAALLGTTAVVAALGSESLGEEAPAASVAVTATAAAAVVVADGAVALPALLTVASAAVVAEPAAEPHVAMAAMVACECLDLELELEPCDACASSAAAAAAVGMALQQQQDTPAGNSNGGGVGLIPIGSSSNSSSSGSSSSNGNGFHRASSGGPVGGTPGGLEANGSDVVLSGGFAIGPAAAVLAEVGLPHGASELVAAAAAARGGGHHRAAVGARERAR